MFRRIRNKQYNTRNTGSSVCYICEKLEHKSGVCKKVSEGYLSNILSYAYSMIGIY